MAALPLMFVPPLLSEKSFVLQIIYFFPNVCVLSDIKSLLIYDDPLNY